MALQDFAQFSEKLAHLKALVPKIPRSVPLSKKSDRINQVFASIPHPEEGNEHHEAFNRRMDALFGEDTRDSTTGRLPNVKRGPFGMDLVVKYLTEASDAGFLIWDIAAIKVDRLISEIEALNASVYVHLIDVSFLTLSNLNLMLSAPVDAPKKAAGASVMAAVEDTDVDSDENDPDYAPPKRAREEPESPTRVYDSDDNEIVEDTEKGTSLVRDS